MAQQVKDWALSVQWLGWLLWCRFDPWPGEISHAMDMVKKKKEQEKEKEEEYKQTPRPPGNNYQRRCINKNW